MAQLAITASKKDHIVYPSGRSISIEADDIKFAFTDSAGLVNFSYYDEQSSKLSYIVCTSATKINSLFAAMTQPTIGYITKINASQVNKPGLLNKSSIVYQTGSGLLNLIYDAGRWSSQKSKRISAYLNAGTSTFAVTAVSQANKTFTVAGNQTATFTANKVFIVTGSTGNDKLYTVVSSTFGAATVITVRETLPSAVADGNIKV